MAGCIRVSPSFARHLPNFRVPCTSFVNRELPRDKLLFVPVLPQHQLPSRLASLFSSAVSEASRSMRDGLTPSPLPIFFGNKQKKRTEIYVNQWRVLSFLLVVFLVVTLYFYSPLSLQYRISLASLRCIRLRGVWKKKGKEVTEMAWELRDKNFGAFVSSAWTFSVCNCLGSVHSHSQTVAAQEAVSFPDVAAGVSLYYFLLGSLVNGTATWGFGYRRFYRRRRCRKYDEVLQIGRKKFVPPAVWGRRGDCREVCWLGLAVWRRSHARGCRPKCSCPLVVTFVDAGSPHFLQVSIIFFSEGKHEHTVTFG